jgi:hypothetical protein
MEGGSLLMLQCNTIGSVFLSSVCAAGAGVDDAGEDDCDELEQPASTPPNSRDRHVASAIPFFIVIPLEKKINRYKLEYCFIALKAIPKNN